LIAGRDGQARAPGHTGGWIGCRDGGAASRDPFGHALTAGLIADGEAEII